MAVDIRDIALGSGIVSLALAAVTFLSTALVKHFLNQDFERYKQGLKSQHDKDLAAYKQQLATQHDKDLEQYKDRLKSESEQALTKYKAELDRNNAIDIERARVLLAEGQAEKDARRDYEYEARKRLYQECQPLLFQLIEVSENAFFQIQSLAKMAKYNQLKPRHSETANVRNSPDLNFIIHSLLAPMVMFRIIQRRLTAVDLTVDSDINLQYLLGKFVYYSFTEHFTLAKGYEPFLEYDPYGRDSEVNRTTYPEKYYSQGLTEACLDNTIESLIANDGGGLLHMISFDEFESAYLQEYPRMYKNLGAAFELFKNFHPKTSPVLWRILILQAFLYQILRKHALTQANNEDIRSINLFEQEEMLEFDWRESENEASDDEVLAIPFDVARKYLTKSLERFFQAPIWEGSKEKVTALVEALQSGLSH